MNKKKLNTTPQQIRKKIIDQVQKFQELSKEVVFLPFANCRLSNILGSRSLKRIIRQTHIISDWKKDYQDVEKMLKLAERLRKNYVNLIFRTGLIRDPKFQKELDVIPLTLWKTIKDYEGKGQEHIQVRVKEWREYWLDENRWERNIGWERRVNEERDYFKKIYGVDPKNEEFEIK